RIASAQPQTLTLLRYVVTGELTPAPRRLGARGRQAAAAYLRARAPQEPSRQGTQGRCGEDRRACPRAAGRGGLRRRLRLPPDRTGHRPTAARPGRGRGADPAADARPRAEPGLGALPSGRLVGGARTRTTTGSGGPGPR